MFGLFSRLLLVIAGFIASFFVAKDALNFNVIQLIIAVLLFTTLVALIAFWPMFVAWIRKMFFRKT
jgi:uncharacterized membrane protein YbhN (UPF0104 family)